MSILPQEIPKYLGSPFKKPLIWPVEVRIDEADLYRYQRYRWLTDKPRKLAMRYRKFNLQALVDASIQASENGGNECVKILKCVEGQFNKAFVLTMSSGNEIVARLPNPNAGPAFFMVASEVATRHLLESWVATVPNVAEEEEAARCLAQHILCQDPFLRDHPYRRGRYRVRGIILILHLLVDGGV
ncbi:hypothetical protein N8T08_007554 [Aspergillus melleus]|uniref:Uncharacterized protein n=1 Tax=Aspergillus melleus TaxID=138277 RepID=A0ACC3AXX5_9EURO|nr:hypothetical protein N8T08_007554 [Aspergillus melleus]